MSVDNVAMSASGIVFVFGAVILATAGLLLLRTRSLLAYVRADLAAWHASDADADADADERYHDHMAVLTGALDDAVIDACKQAGVPACNGRDGPHGESCSIGAVHTRTAQVAQLIADMVCNMGDGAGQAAKMVQLLGDALGDVKRPVVASMGAMVPAHLVGTMATAANHGLQVAPGEAGTHGPATHGCRCKSCDETHKRSR